MAGLLRRRMARDSIARGSATHRRGELVPWAATLSELCHWRTRRDGNGRCRLPNDIRHHHLHGSSAQSSQT